MNTRIKRVLALLMVLAMVFCFIPTVSMTVSADTADGGANGVEGSKTAAPTELDKNHRETSVTLSLPAAERHYVYDVVFVMDSSTSTTNNDVDFSDYVTPLLNEVVDKEAVIKVGVVKCRGRVFDTISLASDGAYAGLVEYSEETAQAITDGIDYPEKSLKDRSSGTNMHGGLDLANDWLAADEEVPNDNKFVILLMDGKTYIWNNEEDEPTTVYTQYMASGKIYTTPAVGQSTGSYTKSAYKLKDSNYYNYTTTPTGIGSTVTVSDMTKCFYSPYYVDIYNSTNEELSSTDTKYDFYCAYADKKGTTAKGSVVTHPVTNGAQFTYNLHKSYYEFIPEDDTETGIKWTELNWLEAAPYEFTESDDDTYTYDLESPNPDFYQVHPDSLQKGLYLTGHLWTDMGEKYHTAAIVYSGWGGGSGLELAKSFCDWIKTPDVSEYSAEITDTDSVNAVFDSIKEDIIYMVASGVVTDIIPDEFTLKIDGADTFKMTVGGESISATQDGENAWNFGEADATGLYPYRIEYTPDTNSFRWIINVPIEVANPVTLTYTLIIDEDAEYGEHDTNVSAVLDYVTSQGDDGEYEFEIPVVTYVELYTVTYNDGVEDEVVFPDQVYPDNKLGDATPAFNGTPTREGYKFLGWRPEVSDTVTGNVTYYAQWEKLPDPVVPPQTGDTMNMTLWIAILALAVTGVGVVALTKKR